MEWSTAIAAEDPVLVVPWQSPDGQLRWVDLREDDFAMDEIREADEHPALLSALRALNSARSPVFTAKCDVWAMEAEELEATRDDLLLEPEQAEAGVACYLDLLWRDRGIFASRHRTEQVLHRLDRMIEELPGSLAKAEAVVRPAVVELEGAVAEGYCLSLYVKGVGVDATEADERWSAALREVVALFRRSELLAL
ncbi:hypothetical protein [Terriglobus aquaticus]|uniref:Uncharacterized protein n=1 Tax=Terriglobus aquaticus TaxID=940139 RepID=A0ABW9KEX8_9BACT|nr:hypothetical protein [Terriglobus aquaticus]